MAGRLCKACGSIGAAQHRFCRGCGSELIDDELPVEQTLVLDFPEPGIVDRATSGCSRVFYMAFGFFMLLSIIGYILDMKGMRYGQRENSRQRACYANMRVILGAIEMYNLDHQQMRDWLSDADVTSPDGILFRSGYLKRPISRPEPDCYYSGQSLTTGGKIVCSRHGVLE